MRKKRILAGIMSLLLIFTSVFTGNIEVRAADVTEINENPSIKSSELSYDDFGPDVGSGLYMVELKNCNASCGSVTFGTTAEASKVNP